jgi:hypothetical protein
LFRCPRRTVTARGSNDVYLSADKVGGQSRQSFTVVLSPAIFYRDILAFGETAFLQTRPECGHQINNLSWRGAMEKADDGYRLLLRVSG